MSGKAYLCDLRAAGICWAGARPWSVERGLDPRDWQRGVPLEWLRATGDAQALRVVKAAEDREARGG